MEVQVRELFTVSSWYDRRMMVILVLVAIEENGDLEFLFLFLSFPFLPVLVCTSVSPSSVRVNANAGFPFLLTFSSSSSISWPPSISKSSPNSMSTSNKGFNRGQVVSRKVGSLCLCFAYPYYSRRPCLALALNIIIFSFFLASS